MDEDQARSVGVPELEYPWANRRGVSMSYQWTCCEWSESEEAVYSNVVGG